MGRKQQQYKADTLHRVVDFTKSNRGTLGDLATSNLVSQVEAAASGYQAYLVMQGSISLAMAGQAERKRSLERELRAKHMQPITQFARMRLVGVPDIAALTSRTVYGSSWKLVQAARAMVAAAGPHRDALVQGGFPADVLETVSSRAEALNQAIVDRANSKVARVGATRGMQEEVKKGRDAVRMLDAVMRQQFGGNDALLASWRVAMRVVRASGSAAAREVDVPAPAPEPVAG